MTLPQQSVLCERERARVHRRTLTVVIISQILGGSGLAAGISVGALLAQDMLGSDALSGLPTGLFTLGSALAAFLVGSSTQRFGRRRGLAYGFIAGSVGATGVVIAAFSDNIALLFAALFIYGAGTATNLQARYAGTDLAPAHKRGFGTSMAMVATTVGAVAGPNLIEPMGDVAVAIAVPALAGPFILAAVAYGAAGLVLIIFLRPDPYLLAREAATAPTAATVGTAPTAGTAGTAQPPTAVGVAQIGSSAYLGAMAMVLSQIVMVAIMTMTPVHMRAHDHGMAAVGLVISLHVAAMWLPSPITGILADRLGRTPMVTAAGLILLASGIVAATAPGDSLPLLILALVLLGVGWNAGLIAGTALVVDGTAPENRPRIQGTIDVLMALGGAGGGGISGVIVAVSSYQVLGLAGGLLALVLVPVLVWARRRHAVSA